MNPRVFLWAEFCIGAWILISPWVLGASSVLVMKWSNVIVGTLLITGSLWRLFPSQEE